METIYYNLDARHVSVCDMASGETMSPRRSYTVLRKVEEKRSGTGGKVLDLEQYRRRHMDGKTGEPELSTNLPATEEVVSRPPNRTWFIADLLATLAILVMAAVVVARFLPLL